MRHLTKRLRLFLASLATAGLLAVIAAPAVHAGQHNAAPGLARAIAAQEFHTNDLLAIPGVVGTAVGLGANGDPVVKIYTAAGGIAGLPGTLDGVGVRIEVTGRFFALHHFCGHTGGPSGRPDPCNGDPPPPEEESEEVDPTARFARPVPIGVSSGTTESIHSVPPFITCSSGTLGARLTDGTNVYALSNNHIYAEEGTATVGAADRIVQPGQGDNDLVCDDGSLDDPTDSIGALDAFVPIAFDVIVDGILNTSPTDNQVDAAIASTTTGLVGKATPSDGYGTPKTNILACSPTTFDQPECINLLGVAVQKYGRTTGLTNGTISGINATMNVAYDSGTARFIDQIIVDGSRGGFLKGGDSGSLLVVNGGGDDRRPVGLLFAGNRSGKTAIANRIDGLLGLLSDLVPGTLTVDGE